MAKSKSVDKQSYTVRFERDSASGWWTAQVIEEPAAISQGRSLDQARRRIREALALVVGDRAARTARLDDDVRLPPPVRRALAGARSERATAEQAEKRAATATRAAARALESAGLSRRDAGQLLGISHQRVQQLLRGAA